MNHNAIGFFVLLKVVHLSWFKLQGCSRTVYGYVCSWLMTVAKPCVIVTYHANFFSLALISCYIISMHYFESKICTHRKAVEE